MSVVEINIDSIKNNILPVLDEEYSYLDSARNNAANVNFPYGEYDWGNVRWQIDDCIDRFNKYSSWIKRITNNMENRINNSVDNINSIEVKEIEKNTITVKR